MRLHVDEVNRIANDITAQDLSVYIHTDEPGDDLLQNRVPNVNPQTASAANWSAAADGDVMYGQDLEYGILDMDNLTGVTHYSILRGAAKVGSGAFAQAVMVGSGGTFKINQNTLAMTDLVPA